MMNRVKVHSQVLPVAYDQFKYSFYWNKIDRVMLLLRRAKQNIFDIRKFVKKFA